MREIKFRAWDDKQMITNAMSATYRDGTDIVTLEPEHDYQLSISTGLIRELMQYTGLKDKNGKEIYEGDVMAVWMGEGKNRKQYTHEVKWNDIGFWELPAPINEFEVIGNIYENPELIK